jgi:very-short-patch-repair endonuclease
MRNQSRQSAKRQALLAQRAHCMRHAQTETEAALWRCLAGKQLGVAFRRQAVIDRFIVDFVAPAIKVVVEVDGGYHVRRAAADARRTRVSEWLGYSVVRVSAELVWHNLAEAVEVVRQAVGIPSA